MVKELCTHPVTHINKRRNNRPHLKDQHIKRSAKLNQLFKPKSTPQPGRTGNAQVFGAIDQ